MFQLGSTNRKPVTASQNFLGPAPESKPPWRSQWPDSFEYRALPLVRKRVFLPKRRVPDSIPKSNVFDVRRRLCQASLASSKIATRRSRSNLRRPKVRSRKLNGFFAVRSVNHSPRQNCTQVVCSSAHMDRSPCSCRFFCRA